MDIAALQRVVGRQNRTTGVTEYMRHPLALEAFPQNARASHALRGVRCLVLHANLPLGSKKAKPTKPAFLAGRDSGAFKISCFSARWFPPHRRGYKNSYPQDYDTNSVYRVVFHKRCTDGIEARGLPQGQSPRQALVSAAASRSGVFPDRPLRSEERAASRPQQPGRCSQACRDRASNIRLPENQECFLPGRRAVDTT